MEAGELTEAQASWWGFDPDDATASLQAAINSGVPRLIVEDMGAPWVVGPIRLNRFGLAESWYQFRQEAFERVAIDWLKANGIPYTEGEGDEDQGSRETATVS